MTEPVIHLSKAVNAFTSAIDLGISRVESHSQRVAYISTAIGEAIGLSESELNELYLASLLHDIGVSRKRELVKISQFELEEDNFLPHCKRGAELLNRCLLFSHLANVVLSHHDSWKGHSFSGLQGNNIPLLSRIIHLADRVEVLLTPNEYYLWVADEIKERIKTGSAARFDPTLVEAFLEVSASDKFWLDLNTKYHQTQLEKFHNSFETPVTIDELEQMAELFASQVDDKSPFTARHSRGVARKAVELAKLFDFSETDIRLMWVAGLLHDLGKLAIPDEILEYPGKLDQKQMLVMKRHTYFTYQLLGQMGPGFSKIQPWAAYHHEKLNGSGYPFGLTGKDLDLGSRIMAVADITQALTEERPYRGAMKTSDVTRILTQAVKDNHLDGDVVNKAIKYLIS